MKKDRYGYIAIGKLLDCCANQKDYAITPNDILRMPRADVVEVVRCKDCEYWSEKYGATDCHICLKGVGVERQHIATPPDGYCAWGEQEINNG